MNLTVQRYKLRFFVIFFNALIASIVGAGTWETFYFNADEAGIEVRPQARESWFSPFDTYGSGWGAQTGCHVRGAPNLPASGVVEAGGTVVCIIYWVPDPDEEEDPAPSDIIDEFSSLSLAGDTVTGQNGLGDPLDTSVPGFGFSIGHRYSVYDGESFIEMTCTPSGVAEVVTTPQYIYEAAAIEYVYAVSPISPGLEIEGTLPDSVNNLVTPSKRICEPGHGLIFIPNCPGYTINSYQWSSFGPFFSYVDWGSGLIHRHVYGVLDPSWWQSPTVTLWPDEPGPSGTPTNYYPAACTMSISSTDGEFTGSVTARRNYSVLPPEVSIETGLGVTSYAPSATGASMVVTDTLPIGIGMNFEPARITTHPKVSSAAGFGNWVFAQIIQLNRKLSFSFAFPSIIKHDVPHLDGPWAYAPDIGSYNADGSMQSTSDSPEHGLIAGWYANKVDISDSYAMHMAYIPPEISPFVQREFISTKRIPWSWHVNGTRTGNTWTGIGPGIQDETIVDFPTWQFQWDDMYNP